MSLVKRLTRWFGDGRFVADVVWGGEYEGLVIHTCFGCGPPEPRGPFELVLCDVHPVCRVLEVARWCARQGLPIDGWIVWGVTDYPGTIWQAGQWLAELARAQPQAKIIVSCKDLHMQDIERLKLSLKKARARDTVD